MIAVIIRCIKAGVFVTALVVYLPISLESSVPYAISAGICTRDSFLNRFIDAVSPDTKTAIRRRTENIRIAVDGESNEETRNHLRKIANEIGSLLPYSTTVLDAKENFNILIVFSENVEEKILSDAKIRRILEYNNYSISEDKIDEYDQVCYERQFEIDGNIMLYFMLLSSQEYHADIVRKCISNGILRSIGIMGNLEHMSMSNMVSESSKFRENNHGIGTLGEAIIRLLYSDYITLGQTPEEVAIILSDMAIDVCGFVGMEHGAR